jgi:SAM-dependent methyltransferase
MRQEALFLMAKRLQEIVGEDRVPMPSEDRDFWDKRYRMEGAIWGQSPSPTAVQAARFLPPQPRVLEVGFGYGRDLAFLLGQRCHVYGIDLSSEGRKRAEDWFQHQGFKAESLMTGRFEDTDLPENFFDVLLSHRMAHLLIAPEAIQEFADKATEVLRPGGFLCLGARNPHDLNPEKMICVGDNVYEYADRPGHRIRYWDESTFQENFANAFRVLSMTETTEPESASRPVPCHLTVMIAQKQNGCA